MVSEKERREIESTVTSRLEVTIKFLQDMIQAPSVNPPGDYSDIHEVVVSRLDNSDWNTETVWAPDELLKQHEHKYPRPNVVSTVAEGSGITIVLNAHLDTVPIDDTEWTYDPFGGTIDGRFVYGRGSKDSKGRVAAYTLASEVLMEISELPGDPTIQLALTADEETGSQAGLKYLLENEYLDCDYAIVEGHIDKIGYAMPGRLRFMISVQGMSAHAGAHPRDGSNAVLGANRLISAIDALDESFEVVTSEIYDMGTPAIVPTCIRGGTGETTVPPTCSFTVNCRVVPQQDIEAVENRIRAVMTDVDLPSGIDFDVVCTSKITPSRTDPNGDLVRLLSQNIRATTGNEVPIAGWRGITDARFFADREISWVNFGPGDEDSNSHGADEHISIDQIKDSATIVAATVLDLARAKNSAL